MQKQILVGSSTGIVKDSRGHYFLQVIISENEYDNRERHDLFLPISKKEAIRLSNQLGIAISKEGAPVSIHSYDVVTL